MSCYNLYIAKVAKFLGITKSRPIFDSAFEVSLKINKNKFNTKIIIIKNKKILNGNDLIEIGLKYATLEKKLGEIDRARGIYSHIS